MQTLFPKLTEPQIRQYFSRTSSLEEAAEVAASDLENLEETKTTELSITTIEDIFRKLSLNMSSGKKSICIDLCFYKFICWSRKRNEPEVIKNFEKDLPGKILVEKYR